MSETGISTVEEYTDLERRVHDLIGAAHIERVKERAIQILQSALNLCEDWQHEADNLNVKLLTIQVLSEFALEEDTAERRSNRWSRALHLLESAASKHSNSRLACSYAFLAVDCYQDLLSNLDLRVRAAALRAARDYVETQLRKEIPLTEAAALLARKSSLLRQLAMLDAHGEQLRRFEESLRCALKAVAISKNAGTLLELGLSEWAVGAHEDSDDKYAMRLRNAEYNLGDDLLRHSEVAQLGLARLFRLTFRPLEACEQYRKLMKEVGNYRRVLRDSYIYAEAAIQLWYRPYPEAIINSHLTSARQLLEEALASGTKTGRHVVDLCQLGAILDGPQAGTTALEEIFTEEGHVSWEQALRLIGRGTDDDKSLVTGFILGLNDGSVWTSLGTFIYKFLRDEELARNLYRYAIRLDPKDPVALTNLARLLVREGKDAAALQQARRLLQKAATFADRRFIWWRSVDAELKTKEGIGHSPKRDTIETDALAHDLHPRNLKEIAQRFKALTNSQDPNQRGLELEQLIYGMAKLTVGIAEAPYTFKKTSGRLSQVDGFFRHGPDRYRVECKWERTPIPPTHIDLFASKLDAAGVGGLVISMSGFSSGAIRAASDLRGQKVILLMDDEEARVYSRAGSILTK